MVKARRTDISTVGNHSPGTSARLGRAAEVLLGRLRHHYATPGVQGLQPKTLQTWAKDAQIHFLARTYAANQEGTMAAVRLEVGALRGDEVFPHVLDQMVGALGMSLLQPPDEPVTPRVVKPNVVKPNVKEASGDGSGTSLQTSKGVEKTTTLVATAQPITALLDNSLQSLLTQATFQTAQEVKETRLSGHPGFIRDQDIGVKPSQNYATRNLACAWVARRC